MMWKFSKQFFGWKDALDFIFKCILPYGAMIKVLDHGEYWTVVIEN